MDKNPHMGHRSRLRDRVRKEGIENFQDYQVLEYLLSFVIPYKDTNVIAHDLIEKFGSFASVLESDEEDLAMVNGMGKVSAHFLSSLIKIYSFYERGKLSRVAEIKKPIDAYEYVRNLFVGKTTEELYLVSLLPNNRILRCEKIAQGSVGQAKVTIRKITDAMSRNKVNNIIIAHNHPGGSSEPSVDDDRLTQALVTSLAINDSFLIDHIVVGESDYYSYRHYGKIDKYRSEVFNLIGHKVAQCVEADYEVEDDQE